ncbi:hypothetical protein QBC44DRAFT_336996 [Cladorrhinum sp. PSN332]|nr:hypothetical protein QBC44DRAFT_336996 [Cladorrhinum sp. PSN332]
MHLRFPHHHNPHQHSFINNTTTKPHHFTQPFQPHLTFKMASSRELYFELNTAWEPETQATFGADDKVTAFYEFPVYKQPREFDFKDCESVSFMNGSTRTGKEEDTIMLRFGAQSKAGHIVVPPGVQVVVRNGSVKCRGEPPVARLIAGAAATA